MRTIEKMMSEKQEIEQKIIRLRQEIKDVKKQDIEFKEKAGIVVHNIRQIKHLKYIVKVLNDSIETVLFLENQEREGLVLRWVPKDSSVPA